MARRARKWRPRGTARREPREESIELRASPRFDSAAGLARLAVLPADADLEKSRAGWTVPLRRPAPRVDRTRLVMAVAYVVALAIAVAIVLV